jgi:hypothetical protein
LPGTHEAHGRLRRFELLSRMTSHVRHKAKYLDVQLIDEQAFVFTDGRGDRVGRPARSLRDFFQFLKVCPANVLAGHARRGDFSQWIAGVFHDRLLASGIGKIEQRIKSGHELNLADSLMKAIQERYDFPTSDSASEVAKEDDGYNFPEPSPAAKQSNSPRCNF